MRDKRPDRDRRGQRPPQKKRSGAALTISAIVIFAFGLLGMIGLFGGQVRDFLCGAFGFVGFAFFALALLATIFKRFVRRHVVKRTAIYGFFVLLIFLVWLQVLTSSAEFDALAPASFDGYVSACYSAGIGTSGGVVIAWLTYLPISWMGHYAAIPLAVLFFVVLFFALLPKMRGSVSSDQPKALKAGKKSRTAPSASGEKLLRLFVDRVRPGQKDACKIKFKGLFARGGEEPQFFDFTDGRPLYAPEGVIPRQQPDRYDLLPKERTADRPEEEYDDYPLPAPEPKRLDRSAEPSRIPADENDEVPPFLKRYRTERDDLTPTKTEQGDPLREPDPFVVRPATTSRTDAPAPAPKQSVFTGLDSLPTARYPKPAARIEDIISDVEDLDRLRGKSETSKAREILSREDVVKPKTPSRVPTPNPVPETPKAPVAPEAPIAPAVPEPLPMDDDTEPFTPLVRPAITPRDASPMRPVEAPRQPLSTEPTPAPVAPEAPRVAPQEPRVAPIAPQTPVSVEENPSDPITRRKPRSDIGGTHRTSDTQNKPMSGFIPPNKVVQPDIESVMAEEEEETPPRPYTAPPVNLLTEFPPIQDDENVEEMGETLIDALASFNINSQVLEHRTGPTFTRFAVTLPDNMSVNKLFQIEKDIKRKLIVNEKDIRIISSVPNLDAVGVEVPNKVVSTVGLRSIINSPVFEQKNKLMFAIGVDVSGTPIYGNLLKMPHLLVAGATGSGKSVCLNVIITSIMYHYSPEFVRFIMIDPKKVELSGYRNMPHMLIPSPITEPDKAINALSWLVDEMERRYDLLMNTGCKDVESYNAKMEKRGGKKLYYIVFIIDEMADLMYVARKEIDEKVNRIAAKARAAGINLILATQRPSVDVITGTIKANLRARIAFKVGSYIDSKTIIDRAGAEGLFGNGDMLYMPADGGDLVRLQGPFISEDELENIVTYVKEHNDCRYDYAAEKTIFASKEAPPQPDSEGGEDDDGEDEFFAPALEFFIDIGQASISKLQIKYHIGYGRAARIVQMMEDRGYLGTAEGGNKTRVVKITREEFLAMYGSGNPIDGEGGDGE